MPERGDRSYPPSSDHYETKAYFEKAKEDFFKSASVYVSDCINGRKIETANRYREMLDLEIAAYVKDRALMLREMDEVARMQCLS